MSSVRELRGEYLGEAEMRADGVKVSDITVHLLGFVDVMHIRTLGQEIDTDGTVSWSGTLKDVPMANQFPLVGKHLELVLPTGKSGTAVIAKFPDELQGMRWPPFPIVYNGREVDDESETA